jgi:hypothetical protein
VALFRGHPAYAASFAELERGRLHGEYVSQRGNAARGAEFADSLDAAELLHVVGSGRDRRGHEATGIVEAVCREVLRDTFVVPDRGGQATDGEREGVRALVQQQVTTVGRIGLVHQPEAVAVAEPVDEGRDLGRQESRGAKPLAIHHQATETPPVGERVGLHRVMVAPRSDGLVEDARQIFDTVPVSRWPVGDEHEPSRLEQP